MPNGWDASDIMKTSTQSPETQVKRAIDVSTASKANRNSAKIARSGIKKIRAHISSRGKRDQAKRDSVPKQS